MRMKGVLKASTPHVDATKTCARCRQPFGWFSKRGEICAECKHQICIDCRQELPKKQWICNFCLRQMSVFSLLFSNQDLFICAAARLFSRSVDALRSLNEADCLVRLTTVFFSSSRSSNVHFMHFSVAELVYGPTLSLYVETRIDLDHNLQVDSQLHEERLRRWVECSPLVVICRITYLIRPRRVESSRITVS